MNISLKNSMHSGGVLKAVNCMCKMSVKKNVVHFIPFEAVRRPNCWDQQRHCPADQSAGVANRCLAATRRGRPAGRPGGGRVDRVQWPGKEQLSPINSGARLTRKSDSGLMQPAVSAPPTGKVDQFLSTVPLVSQFALRQASIINETINGDNRVPE